MIGITEYLDADRKTIHYRSRNESGPELENIKTANNWQLRLKDHAYNTYFALVLRIDPEIAYDLLGKSIRGAVDAVQVIAAEAPNRQYITIRERSIKGALDKLAPEMQQALAEQYAESDRKFYDRVEQGRGGGIQDRF